jgi:hypothetical protein
VLVVHLVFILFVLFGGFAVLYKRWFVWLHVPAMAWGAMLSFMGWICPLTPLENSLRRAAGEAGYTGGFVAHYLVPVIYPQTYNRDFAVAAGIVVLILNLAIYAYIVHRVHRRG